MKISIITACYNNEATIRDSLESVKNQDYTNIEHIIIDGGSSDNTVAIAQEYEHVAKIVSEKDKGIYDALNKGLKAATGDVIGFLHSDDFFADDSVISKIAQGFADNPESECVYGDIVFINEEGKVIRYYSSASWNPSKFRYGRMPAHTSFFAKREAYENEPFDLNFRIGGDFEQLIRILLVKKRPYTYLPLVTTHMRPGGASTDGFRSNLTINKEILEACRQHGIKTNYLLIYSKYFKKIFEFARKG